MLRMLGWQHRGRGDSAAYVVIVIPDNAVELIIKGVTPVSPI